MPLYNYRLAENYAIFLHLKTRTRIKNKSLPPISNITKKLRLITEVF